MTDLSIFITVAGLCLSVATFYFGRQSVTKADGKAAGALETDLRYIKESVGRIEGQLNRDVQRLEGRIDEISNQLAGISNTAGRAHESAKSALKHADGALTDEEYEPTRAQRAEYRKQINDLQAAIETLETTEGQVVDNE